MYRDCFQNINLTSRGRPIAILRLIKKKNRHSFARLSLEHVKRASSYVTCYGQCIQVYVAIGEKATCVC